MGLLGSMSAIGTALGPSLGGFLISGLGWRAIFFLNLPLGILTLLFAYRYLPLDRQGEKAMRAGYDYFGTLVMAATLAAYALAMTLGRGDFGMLNAALLLIALLGTLLFLAVEKRAASPLVQISLFRDRQLSISLGMSAIVSTVLMATLVVGPFYLSRALGLSTAMVGTVMSVGPVVVILAGMPFGRLVDRFGADQMTTVGLVGIAIGSLALAIFPMSAGISGYVVPIVIITMGYALFQTANNTSVMKEVVPEQRGVISGLLNLSRNLGLITGASAMGAVFAIASGSSNIVASSPESVAAGFRTTFVVAAVLIVALFAVVARGKAVSVSRFSKGHRVS
jgi:MFS family permease